MAPKKQLEKRKQNSGKSESMTGTKKSKKALRTIIHDSDSDADSTAEEDALDFDITENDDLHGKDDQKSDDDDIDDVDATVFEDLEEKQESDAAKSSYSSPSRDIARRNASARVVIHAIKTTKEVKGMKVSIIVAILAINAFVLTPAMRQQELLPNKGTVECSFVFRTQLHLKQLLKMCKTDLSLELQKSKYGCLFFFGMAKADSVIEERVNALRDRPEDMKGLRYPQVVVDGWQSHNANFRIFL